MATNTIEYMRAYRQRPEVRALRNKQELAYAKRRYRENRAKGLELLGGKCVSCGTTDKLHFDHIDEDSKQEVFEVVFRSNVWEKVKAVLLEKAQLLCNVCHGRKSVNHRWKD